MRLLGKVKFQVLRHQNMVGCCLEKPGFLHKVEQETRFFI